jgi:O-antigen ligase
MSLPTKASLVAGLREFFAILPAFYILTLMWWFPSGDKYVAGLTVGAMLLYGACGKWPVRNKDVQQKQKLFLLASWLFVGVTLISYGINDGSWSELRAVLVMAVYISFFWGVRFNARVFQFIALISATGFIVLTYSQFLNTGGGRIGGFINPIPYATAVGSVAVLFLAMALFSTRAFWQRAIFGGLFILLVVALFLTKTRGVLIPVFLVTGGLLFALLMMNKRKKRLQSFVIATVLVGFVAIAGNVFFKDRLAQTYNEYEQMTEGNYDGSMGVRLQLWLTAVELIVQEPIIGHGKGYRDALESLYLADSMEERLYLFNANHFHNQYIDTIVKKGLVGGAALLLLLGAGVQMAYRSPRATWQRYSGLAVILVYGGSALTDVPLIHAHTIFLFFGICFLISAIGTETEHNTD